MKNKNKNKILSCILSVMLIVAMAFTMTGCTTDQKDGGDAPATENQTQTIINENILGEGQTEFLLTVADGEGNEESFEIHTDKTTVGDALLELGLIEGEEGPYGLYVKTVNGTTADYDTDKTYWAFYVNGEYAMSGVDTTEIEENTEYTLKREK